MYLSYSFLCLILLGMYLVESLAPMTCDEGKMTQELDECLKPFNEHYRNGVEVLRDMTDAQVNNICESFEKIKPCMFLFMHYCPEVKKKHNKKLNKFEYACTADRKLDNWPIMPGVNIFSGDDDDLSKENEERKWTILKACLAAGVTVILVLVCAICEIATKLRVYLKVRKAAKASAQSDHQSLIKKPSSDPSNDEVLKGTVKA